MIVFDFRDIRPDFFPNNRIKKSFIAIFFKKGHNRKLITADADENKPLLKILKHFLSKIIDIKDLESDCLSISRNDR